MKDRFLIVALLTALALLGGMSWWMLSMQSRYYEDRITRAKEDVEFYKAVNTKLAEIKGLMEGVAFGATPLYMGMEKKKK